MKKGRCVPLHDVDCSHLLSPEILLIFICLESRVVTQIFGVCQSVRDQLQIGRQLPYIVTGNRVDNVLFTPHMINPFSYGPSALISRLTDILLETRKHSNFEIYARIDRDVVR